jgi:hypothetical protein
VLSQAIFIWPQSKQWGELVCDALKHFLPDDPAVLPEELLARHIFSVPVKRVRRPLAAALDQRATGIDPRLGVNCIVESIMDAEQIEAEIVALGRRSTPVQIVHAKPVGAADRFTACPRGC